jgi:hypothetical protein
MPTYAELHQHHPSLNHARLAELSALYEGGEKLERVYSTLLPQRERESARRYDTRLKEAQYRNYLGPIVDYFVSMLFVSKPVLKAKRPGEETTADAGEYWAALRNDCDRAGTDIDALFRETLTDAMVERTGWVRIHQPADGAPLPTDGAAFDARKLGDCWLEHLDCHGVIDWETGDDGRLLWALTHKTEARRLSIGASRDTIVETWDYLTPTAVETFRIQYTKETKPKATDEVASLGATPHTFGRVPLVCLDLPPALWVANRLRSPQLAHFRKVNAQAWSMSATCYAMRQYFVGNPEEFQKIVNGPGYEIVLHKDDKAEWDAPPSEHFSALDVEIKSEKDEIFRVAHQMALGVENNAAAVGRSADSKASDMESTRVALVAFSRQVKETIKVTLDLITRARGEDFEWSVEGLDDFAALDVDAFLGNLALLNEKVGKIPSKTFAIQANTRVAEALLRDLDEETKVLIREEIKAGTTDPAEDAMLEREAAAEMFGTEGSPKKLGVGTTVTVKPGEEHDEMTAGQTGTVVEIGGPALGIQFPGSTEVHRWYTADELVAAKSGGSANGAGRPGSASRPHTA